MYGSRQIFILYFMMLEFFFLKTNVFKFFADRHFFFLDNNLIYVPMYNKDTDIFLFRAICI